MRPIFEFAIACFTIAVVSIFILNAYAERMGYSMTFADFTPALVVAGMAIVIYVVAYIVERRRKK